MAFQVPGPTSIWVIDNINAAYTLLGYTPNDDLVSYEEEIFMDPLTSTFTGDTPGDYVHRGKVGSIALTLVDWDDEVLGNLLAAATAGDPPIVAEGALGEIGRTHGVVNSAVDSSFGLRIDSDLSGMPSKSVTRHQFDRCFLVGPNAHRAFDFGNQARMEALSITVLPVTGLMYIKSVVD